MTSIDESTTRTSAPPDGGTTVLAWAQARKEQAREVRREAEKMRVRVAAGRATLAARHAMLVDRARLRRRLTTAESRAAHLQVALASNRRIGMAVGVLLARHGLTEDQAFERLREYSNHRNVRLAAVAEQVIYTGDLPAIVAGR